MLQRNFYFIALLCYVLTITFTSCIDNASLNPKSKLILPFVSEYETIADTVNGAILVQRSLDSIFVTVDSVTSTVAGSSNYMVTGEFTTGDGDVDAGSMTFNSTTVPNTSGNFYSTPEVIHYSGPTYGSTFNGTFDHFHVNGSTNFPAFTDSMLSPNGLVVMTSPISGSSVSKSSNLTITWSGTRDTSSKIAIEITDTSGNALTKLTTDNGSYTIASSELTSFSTSDHHATIRIYKYKYKIATVPSISLGTKKVGLVEVSHHSKSMTFTP